MKKSRGFSKKTKHLAILRQGGVCAFCGVSLVTSWTNGEYQGYAHHLKPIRHKGNNNLNNCVYLCWGHHLLLGHGMAPFGIDRQGGNSKTWIKLSRNDFSFWEVL
ncbi:HNH endonuclease [bacterium]|nr:HNH endonuclease [bacterium]